MSIFGRVHTHLLALGVKENDAKAFARNIELWNECSGPEWTVERLKSLRAALVDMLATRKHYVVPLGWATSKNRKGEVIFEDHVIHTIFSSARDNLKLAENALRVYQVITLDDVSKKQLNKMVKAVTSPSNAVPEVLNDWVTSIKVRATNRTTLKNVARAGRRAAPLIHMIGTPKRSPAIESENGSIVVKKTRARNAIESRDVWTLLFQDKATKELWFRYPEDVSRAIIGTPMMTPVDTFEDCYDIPGGTITAIQEGGCKARWIANPHLLYQSFGEPLKLKLQSFSQRVYPEIRVDDQDSGRQQVADWLSEGKTVYCYDCSSFTDRFPIELQISILQQLRELEAISQFDYESFMLVIGKEWYYRGVDGHMRWTVGQPLGYGPSFALATLTHAAILDLLDVQKLGLYMVVGDDVVIACPIIAEKYHNVMTGIGVEINQSKSVISPNIGEFLGKLITMQGVNPSIKVRPMNTVAQVVHLIEFYGDEFLELLGGKWWEAKLLAHTPFHLGGLGLKPKGITLKDHLSMFDMNKVQSYLIRNEISEFHRSRKWDSQSVGQWMALKQLMLEPYTDILDLIGETEIQHHYGYHIRINALGVLSNTENTRLNANQPSTNSFHYLIDKFWFLEPWTSSTVNTNQMLNTFGYIDCHQIPSSLDDSWDVSFNNPGRKCHDDIQYQSTTRFYRRPRQAFATFERGTWGQTHSAA